jgi:hypothetical protein
LTEIYLCHACSCQEIVRRNGRGLPSAGEQAGVDGDEVAEEEAVAVAVADPEAWLDGSWVTTLGGLLVVVGGEGTYGRQVCCAFLIHT